MLNSEIVLVFGLGTAIGGAAISLVAKTVGDWLKARNVRIESERVAAELSKQEYQRTVVDQHLNSLETSHSALKHAFGQGQISNTTFLAHITRLEGLLHEAGIEFPPLPKLP